MCALYAFMRVCDDIGDDESVPVDERERRLSDWRAMLNVATGGQNEQGEPRGVSPRITFGDQRTEVRDQRTEVRGQRPVLSTQYSVRSTQSGSEDLPIVKDALPGHQSPVTNHQSLFPALTDTLSRHAVPTSYLHDVIDGVAADLRFSGFETFEDLNRYCYQVAGAVGLCCVHIWGFHDEAALPLAVDCGTAFQLTNILRDLGEDAAMGRCYLPREDLRRFDLTEADFAAHVRDDRFRELMRFQVSRAREYYAQAGGLFDCIDRPGKPILAAMLKIYGGLLDEIERRDYDVYSERVSLSRGRKLRIALGAVIKHRVFRRPGP